MAVPVILTGPDGSRRTLALLTSIVGASRAGCDFVEAVIVVEIEFTVIWFFLFSSFIEYDFAFMTKFALPFLVVPYLIVEVDSCLVWNISCFSWENQTLGYVVLFVWMVRSKYVFLFLLLFNGDRLCT